MYKYRQNLMCSSSYTCSGYCYESSRSESGRSMVEMLGVLAVIGVLSVAGVAGFKTAMDKHRANELLNEASKRAVIVATQRQTGRAPSIAEFDNTLSYGVFSDTVKSDDTHGGFALTVTGVDKNVCEQIKNITSTNPQINGECDGTADLEFVYKNDLSAVDFVFNDSIGEEDDDIWKKDEEGDLPYCSLYKCENNRVYGAGAGCTSPDDPEGGKFVYLGTCTCVSDGVMGPSLEEVCSSSATDATWESGSLGICWCQETDYVCCDSNGDETCFTETCDPPSCNAQWDSGSLGTCWCQETDYVCCDSNGDETCFTETCSPC